MQIGLELACVVLCCLMLVNALRVGASFVSEEEEAEFMHKVS